jgi:hypothetical protein
MLSTGCGLGECPADFSAGGGSISLPEEVDFGGGGAGVEIIGETPKGGGTLSLICVPEALPRSFG